ncbi:AraC family transcriptional regulator [Paenibacillaceae bacterium]|nr:AraC family transcriptional regulator [Paenibacillaceae bacterium]
MCRKVTCFSPLLCDKVIIERRDHMTASLLRKSLEGLHVTVSAAAHVQLSANWRHRNHVTANNCIYFFREGEGMLSIRDSTFYPQPGDLYVLPVGARISFSTTEPSPFRLMFCHFHALVGQLPLFQIVDTPLYIRLQDQARAVTLFDRLIQGFQRTDDLAPLATKAAIFELLLFIWEQEPRKPEPVNPPALQRWHDILHYMEQHATEPLSIPEIAVKFNYSPKYFFRYFKSTFGQTPHQYLLKLRMERAKQLLLTTDWTVSRIASELGMERSHFSRLFLGYTDMTPSRFRSWTQVKKE